VMVLVGFGTGAGGLAHPQPKQPPLEGFSRHGRQEV